MIAGGGAPPPTWFLGAFAALFPFVWCFVSFVLSFVGGWHELARRHPAGPKPKDGVDYPMCSGRTGEFGASYKGCLNVTIAREGLYMVPLFLFRAFHPPLLLPWSCVAGMEERQFLLTRALEVRCEVEARKITLFLPPQAAGTIAAMRHPDA